MNRTPRGVALVLAGFLTLASGTATSITPAAAATIRDQWYTGSYGLKELHAQGLDGTGVKIAVIDSAPPDLSVPELAGVNPRVVSTCKDKPSRDSIDHTTSVMSVLASPDFGWAPKADYTVYVRVPKLTTKLTDRNCAKKKTYGVGYLINQALNDGADLITIQVVEMAGTDAGYAMARAALMGVPILVGVGNNGRDYIWGTPQSNVVVGVGAVDKKGQHAEFSSTGEAVTVVAPGKDIKIRTRGPDGKLSEVIPWKGTSLATPMVAGALALAMQKWPQANGNQLIRSLIDTADRTTEGHSDQFGWGQLDARELVATDPSAQSTENPLLDKLPDYEPNAQQYADYRDEVADPHELSKNDTGYVYRGDDQLICEDAPKCELGTSPRLNPSASPSATSASPAASASATPGAAPAAADQSPLPAVLGGAALLIVAAGAAAGILIPRRRRAQQEASAKDQP